MHGVLKGKIVAVSDLSDENRRTMHQLMVRYYDHIQWDRFNYDLDEKQHVILLLAGKKQEIKGFSTLMLTETNVNGRTVRAIFSGDTVVDQAYWGQRVLGRFFLKYLFQQKAKHPLSPLYWLLISKGYKTYLLMANNFTEHYPRFEKATPTDKQKLIDIFATDMFGDCYDQNTGCCQFPESLGQLREGVAHLSKSEIDGNERIKFFVEKNPNWSEGEELVCIAEMTWSMPVYYLVKSWWKLTTTPLAKRKAKAQPTSVQDDTGAESGLRRPS
ncbi:MAG: hypothetical protein MI867_19975 [Pseudomonadales bacterium]|nr:hypothetical protein [Pseudomonadales bacterium]